MRAMHINQIKNVGNKLLSWKMGGLTWNRRICFVLCCGLLCLCGCRKPTVAAQERVERESALYRKAFAAEQSGDLQEAIRLYNRVLIEEPKSFSAHFQLATLLHDHSEDYIGAIYHYKQYLYLRPETGKNTLAQDRIRIAEQLLAPQILKKVGDSVQGLSQAHLLKENERLNRVITTLEGEKSLLVENKEENEKTITSLRDENAHLRGILQKMRVSEAESDTPSKNEKLARSVEPVAPPPRTDTSTLRALRAEAQALSKNTVKPHSPTAGETPAETVLQKVQTRLTDAPASQVSTGAEEKEGDGKNDVLSRFSIFGNADKASKKSSGGRISKRTYVVQPGDSLFRVAEKFYGDASDWKKIREANRTTIDPDGRIRAGQIIVVP